ncbi:alpha-ketoacid dehydrogenase subunit beta [Chloroflexota bacterium]
MREITYKEAIREALREELRRDQSVYLIGQDIGIFGGVLGVPQGLWEEFGDTRIIDAPISEVAIMGSSIGAALVGLRPVVDLMFAEFLPSVMDLLVNHAAKMRYITDGEAKVPLVVRVAFGIGPHRLHPENFEVWFLHTPGIKVVMPSTPYDAKGLLKTSIRDDDPVLFFEHKYLYDQVKGPVPEEEYTIPFGLACVVRPGTDVTVVATARMVHEAESAAEELAGEGIDVEIIDPRTLVPLDSSAILGSVKKTGRLVIAHEAWKKGGIGAEISAMVTEEAFGQMKAPIMRVGALDVPIPNSPRLERLVVPSKEKIVTAVRKVISNV